VKFDLKAVLKLTRQIPEDAKDFIADLIAKVEEKEFLKGCPADKREEAPRIVDWKILDDGIWVHIMSGRYVRSHVAILRLKNVLAANLGRKYKIGVKDIEVQEFKIETEVSEEPLEPVRLPFVKELRFDGKKVYLELEDIDEKALRDNYIDRLLRRLEEKIIAQRIRGKAEFVRTVRRSEPRLHKYKLRSDPTEEAVRLGWVKEYPGAGVWQLLPPFTALIRAIEQLVIDRIAKPLGFIEVIFPRLIPLDVEKRKGQLAIPHEMLFVCPPISRNVEDFEDFIDLVEITDEIPVDLLKEKLRPPLYALSYAQCEPFYELFRNEIVDASELEKNPIKFFDRNGPTWRWEGGGLKGLERLNEFHRIEFTWLTTPEKCIEIRDQVLERAVEIIDKIFDLEWRVDATTAVYLEHAGKVEKEESTEFVKTYDLTVILPFQTKSRPEAELEISSFHVHTDFYAKRFRFRDRANRPIWTGCAGIGPSRWAYVFLTRWGFEFNEWPDEIKKYIGDELPEVPKLITWPPGGRGNAGGRRGKGSKDKEP